MQLDGGGFCDCLDQDDDGYDICDPGHPYDTDGSLPDCDDFDAEVNPGADEYCDGIDNNCDGQVDNDAVDAQTWYADLDDDGWGDELNWVLACEMPAGYTSNYGDCDDNGHPPASCI